MRKRIWAVLLSICLMVGLLPTVAFAGGEWIAVIYQTKKISDDQCKLGLLDVMQNEDWEAAIIVEPEEDFEWPAGETLTITKSFTLSGKWNIPAGITLDLNQFDVYQAESKHGYVAKHASISLRGKISMSGQKLNCDVDIYPGAEIQVGYSTDTSLVIPAGTTWTLMDGAVLDRPITLYGTLTGTGKVTKPVTAAGSSAKISGDVEVQNGLRVEQNASLALSTSAPFKGDLWVREGAALSLPSGLDISGRLSVGENATVSLNGTLAVTMPEENPDVAGDGSFLAIALSSGSQLALGQNGRVELSYPCNMSGGSRDEKPARPLIAGSGILHFTWDGRADAEEWAFDDWGYPLLCGSLEEIAHNRAEYAAHLAESVKIDYDWNCNGIHEWIEVEHVDASCTKSGFTRYICLGCMEFDYRNEGEEFQPTGHSFGETPGEDGKYHCTKCGLATETKPGTLANPTSLIWGIDYYAETGEDNKKEGAISWTAFELTGHRHEYQIKVYREGTEEPVFTDKYYSMPYRDTHNMTRDLFASKLAEFGSGTYYFTVQALPYDSCGCEPSVAVQSGSWTYTHTGEGSGTETPAPETPAPETPQPERPSSGGGYYPSTPSTGGSSTTTTTTTNPDGSTTTTVTNKNTGTVTETTTSADGGTTVVESKTDGTVTTTHTAANGVKVSAVNAPGTQTTATVTVPPAVGAATVTIPAAVTPGMVAVDAQTGEIIKLSVPTGDGLAVRLEGSADIVLEDRSKDYADTGSHWASDDIDFVTAHGMFSGTSDTAFSPNAPMTRSMVMTVLARFEGVDTSGGDTWYEKGMEWSKTAGVSDGTNPNQPVSQEQLVTMLYRYVDSPGTSQTLDSFPDAGQVSGYAEAAMRWAVETGLIVGSNGQLNPQGRATRAEVAAILSRFCTNLTV